MKRLSSMALREKMCPVCFPSLSLSHSCCHIPKSMPIHSSPLPSLFSPNLGPPLHCFLLAHLFLPPSLPLTPSSLSLTFFPNPFLKFSCKISFIQSVLDHKTCHIRGHKRICVQETMSVSPRSPTSSFFNLLFFDNADTVCNITAHGVGSHCAHF